MKKLKVYDISDFPSHLREEINKKIWHCGGSCKWYPGDGHFKPLNEVKDMSKIHFYKSETINTKDVYVYEMGDDLVGDFLMEQGAKLCEEIVIIQ